MRNISDRYDKIVKEFDEMTDQLRQTLQMNYDLAKKSGDAGRITDAQEAMHWAELECQAHTSERVKRIERDVIDIKTQILELKGDLSLIKEQRNTISDEYKQTNEAVQKLSEELRSIHDKGRGAYLILRLLYCFLAGGGAMAAVKIFKIMGWV